VRMPFGTRFEITCSMVFLLPLTFQ
jgi:hypothetical protein